jgi:serine/threonine-protein kinase
MAEVRILCPICHKPNTRTTENFRTARFCQHCGRDVVLNNVPGATGPRYYITRVIKEGGQGAVYEAIDDSQRVYAVKEMLDRFTDKRERGEALERFEEEADMLLRLSHSRIPRIYASFEDEQRHYLAMDFVRGEDLEDVIRREGSIPEARALAWADQVFDVIEYLHRQRPPIIFRDMKPSNIMIERDGGVKIIDFGIAKVLQGTQRGTQIGTPGYAPPEQYQGLATVASDVYALGATLHHMLTGRDPRDEPPFSFSPVYGLKPSVSRRTSDAVQRALQMRPEDRWPSVAEFRTALIPAPPPARTVPQPAPAQRPAPPPSNQSAPAQRPAPPPSSQPAPAQRPAPPPSNQSAPAQRPAPARPPAASAPAQAARPAPPPPTARVGALPTPASQPAPAAQPPAKQRRGGGFTRFVFWLLAIALVGGVLLFAFPDLAARYVPFEIPNPLPAPTAQTLIQRPYSVDLEVVVPSGQDVRGVFMTLYERRAREEFGPGVRVSSDPAPAFVGEPQELGEDASGTKYRGTISGYVLVPQS